MKKFLKCIDIKNMKTPTLKFILDDNYAINSIREMLEANVGYGKIAESLDFNFYKERIKEKGIQLLMQKNLSLYQKAWDEINNKFFKKVRSLTGFAWAFEEYKCVLNPWTNESSWGENTIMRICSENPYTAIKITTHELILANTFSILNKLYSVNDGYLLTEKDKWALSEICALIITGSDEMAEFWPWVGENQRYMKTHCYPELYVLQDLMKNEYDKHKNFKKTLEFGINYIQKVGINWDNYK